MQLNKFIAHSGLCSRRKAESLVENRQITINDQIITNCAYRVTETDIVRYKGEKIEPRSKIYILLNKPKGYITTVSDEKKRKTVIDLITAEIKERVYPVGRLDRATTGLIILTNDGLFAQKLAHPKFNIKKVYNVGLDKPLNSIDLNKIKKGIHLDDGFIKVDNIEYHGNQYTAQIELHSGKNLIIRRIFAHLGYQVIMLDRVKYAGLTKKKLQEGCWRLLTDSEIEALNGESNEQKKEKQPKYAQKRTVFIESKETRTKVEELEERKVWESTLGDGLD